MHKENAQTPEVEEDICNTCYEEECDCDVETCGDCNEKKDECECVWCDECNENQPCRCD